MEKFNRYKPEQQNSSKLFNQHENPRSSSKPTYPISFAIIEKIYLNLESKKLLVGSYDLIEVVQVILFGKCLN